MIVMTMINLHGCMIVMTMISLFGSLFHDELVTEELFRPMLCYAVEVK